MSAVDVATSLIKRWEGFRLEAYPDPATGGKPYTIGYGSTGPDIHKDTLWTKEQAEERLRWDVAKFMGNIKNVITVPVTDNQLGAMTSLAYNIGSGAFAKSTLLRKLNNRDYSGASAEFTRWNKAAGKVMAGLTNRRLDEKKVFNT